MMDISDDPQLFLVDGTVVHAHSDWASVPESDQEIATPASQVSFRGIALELFQMTRENRRERFETFSNAEKCDLIGGVMDCISDLSNIITKQNADIAALQDEVHRVRESGSQPGSSSGVHAAESAPANAALPNEVQDEQSTGRQQESDNDEPAPGSNVTRDYAAPARVPNYTGLYQTCGWTWDNISCPGMDEHTFEQLMGNVFHNWDKNGGDNQRCTMRDNWVDKAWAVASSLNSLNIMPCTTFGEGAAKHFWTPSTSDGKWLFLIHGRGKSKCITMGCIGCQRYDTIYYTVEGRPVQDTGSVRMRISAIFGE